MKYATRTNTTAPANTDAISIANEASSCIRHELYFDTCKLQRYAYFLKSSTILGEGLITYLSHGRREHARLIDVRGVLRSYSGELISLL